MMMETVVYSREFLFVKELFDKGELGVSSICSRAISKIWMAGLAIGTGYLRCITPPIV